ncbi:hypothetical protein Tco_0782035, partial [Tanacetum coccineum]
GLLQLPMVCSLVPKLESNGVGFDRGLFFVTAIRDEPGLLLLLLTITISGSELLILSAYAPSMPPLLSLPLSMACDDSDGHNCGDINCERLCIISALDIRHVLCERGAIRIMATEKDEIIHSLASQRIAFAAMAGKHDTIAALNALNAKNCPTRVFALTVISDGAVSLMPPITSLPPFMADKLQSKPTDHFFASYFREYLKIMEAYMDIILQYKILCSANLKLLVDTSTAIVKVTGVSQQKLSPRIKRNVLTQGERAEHATPGHSGQLNAEYNCSEVIEKTNTNPATEAEDVVIRSALGPGSQRSSECELAAFYAGFHEVDVDVVSKAGEEDRNARLLQTTDKYGGRMLITEVPEFKVSQLGNTKRVDVSNDAGSVQMFNCVVPFVLQVWNILVLSVCKALERGSSLARLYKVSYNTGNVRGQAEMVVGSWSPDFQIAAGCGRRIWSQLLVEGQAEMLTEGSWALGKLTSLKHRVYTSNMSADA